MNRWAIIFRPGGLGQTARHQRLVHGQQDEPFWGRHKPSHPYFPGLQDDRLMRLFYLNR